MTPAEYRAAFERELGLTLDLEVRDTLLEAMRLGLGSRAWSQAAAIVDQREIARQQMASPSRRRGAQTWREIQRDLERDQRRGRFVAIVARLILAALVVGAFFLLGFAGCQAVWGSS